MVAKAARMGDISRAMTTPRKPSWLKVRAPGGPKFAEVKERMRSLTLNTVCEEARCPNMGECWAEGTATVMILGDVCTRGCRFCAVTTGKPPVTDLAEPFRVGEAISKMGLRYVVITSVNRDDLPDGGADIFARTIRATRARQPDLLIEVLTPDFAGDPDAVKAVADAAPDTFAHNVETVPRLQRKVREARCSWEQSVKVLEHAKVHAVRDHALTKTSIMVGVGETEAEVIDAMKRLRDVGCDVVTFGQYLRPTSKHLEVVEYVTPAQFDRYRDLAVDLGFVYCASGPLVRSSYRAGEFFLTSYFDKRRAS